MIESTPEHLEEFGAYCRKWVDALHLNDWDCRYAIQERETGDANAWCNIRSITRKVLFCLCPQREEMVCIEDLAKHECLEVLLADMCADLARYYSDDFVAESAHRVINRIMVAMKG